MLLVHMHYKSGFLNFEILNYLFIAVSHLDTGNWYSWLNFSETFKPGCCLVRICCLGSYCFFGMFCFFVWDVNVLVHRAKFPLIILCCQPSVNWMFVLVVTVVTWMASLPIRHLPKTATSVHSVSANTATFQWTASRVVGHFSDFLSVYFLCVLTVWWQAGHPACKNSHINSQKLLFGTSPPWSNFRDGVG